MSDIEDTFDIGNREHDKLSEARQNDGYREGLSEAKEKSVQDGFNHGYTISYKFTFLLSTIDGVLSALKIEHSDNLKIDEVLSTVQSLKKQSTTESKVQDLNTVLTECNVILQQYNMSGDHFGLPSIVPSE